MSEEKKTKKQSSDDDAPKKASAEKAPAAKASASSPKKPTTEYMLPERWAGLWKIFGGAAAVGLAGAGAGYAVDPTRFAFSWLFGLLVTVTLALGAIFFVLIQHVTSAGWSVTVRRTAEFFASGTPVFVVLVVPLAVVAPTLYGHWMNAGAEHGAESGEHEVGAAKKDEHSQLETPRAAMTLAQNDVAPTATATVRADTAGAATATPPPPAVASALAAPQTALKPTTVAFEGTKKDVPPAGKTALLAVANFLKANGTEKVDVTPFAERGGDTDKNVALARDRSKAIVDMLVDMGIAKDRINVQQPQPAPADQARRVQVTLAAPVPPPAVTAAPIAQMTERTAEPEDVPVITKKDHGDPEELLEHEAMGKKTWWLSKNFFYGRMPIYVLVWIALGMWLLRTSTSQDESKDVNTTRTMAQASTVGLILFALSLTGAAFDWIMSLDPTWYSTIFGVCFFAGSAVAGLATLVVVLTSMRDSGILTREITVEHYHDIGKLMFGFMCFWAYVSFSQFMLIWYASIPEETTFFHHRWDGEGPWKTMSLLIVFFHFAVPFIGIMSRNVKRRLGLLKAGAILLLTMHVVELYWLVMPNVPLAKGATFSIHWMDIMCLVGCVCAYLALVFRNMTQHRIIPVGDPRLQRALKFENA